MWRYVETSDDVTEEVLPNPRERVEPYLPTVLRVIYCLTRNGWRFKAFQPQRCRLISMIVITKER